MGRLPRVMTPLGIFTIATVLGVLTGLQAYNYVAFTSDHKQPFGPLLALNLTYWYSWALLVPGVIWMSRRYRFERQTWRRAAMFHALAVVVFTLLHVTLATSARGVILTNFTERSFNWWLYFRERFFLNFDWEMMTYWAVVAFINAFDYHRESQERELAAAQLQTQLAEAQLEALQRQLHPHFLFNTLNTIATLMHRDVHAADEMLVQLGDLLRLTLDRIGTQQVPLTDEVEFLRKYLEIEQRRFGDPSTDPYRRGPECARCACSQSDPAAPRRERAASRHWAEGGRRPRGRERAAGRRKPGVGGSRQRRWLVA